MTTTKKTASKAGPKPTYQVVEETLYAQTSKGEIKVPFAAITTRKLRGIVRVMDNELDALDYLCDEIFPPEVDELPITESVPLMMRFMEEIGVLFGATLGELQSSSQN